MKTVISRLPWWAWWLVGVAVFHLCPMACGLTIYFIFVR